MRTNEDSRQPTTIELGESQTKQQGINGEKVVIHQVHKSLFNIIFGGTSGREEEVSSRTVREPVHQIISNGTRKYQYMYCTNGAYRYFTDEQFKDANTGFTHKSPDYCAQNKQGKMTKLADSAPGSNKTANVKPYIPSNCTTTTVPYTTSYQKVSYLQSGQTQSSGGIDGYKVSCMASSTGYKPADYTIQPINKIVYQGTGTTSSSYAPTYTTSDAQAKYKCDSDYSSAKAKLGIAGCQAPNILNTHRK